MAGRYTVRILKKAKKELKSLHPEIHDRILEALIELRRNPRPHGVKKLKGADDLWRIRVGDYRVIYQISDRELVVLIIRVRHRSEAYR